MGRRFRIPQNVVTGLRRRISGFLYDDVRYTASGNSIAAVTSSLFMTPNGQGTSPRTNSGTKTYLDTNMKLAGQMDGNTVFIAYRMGCGCVPALASSDSMLSSMGVLIASSALKLKTPGYEFEFGPCDLWPGGFGMSGWTGSGSYGMMSNGVPLPGARKQLPEPIIFERGASFSVDHYIPVAITTTGTTDVLIFQVVFEGIWYFPV